MVWGSFGWNAVGNLAIIEETMTKEVYQAILDKNLRSSSRKIGIGRTFIFQQDNDPKHTSKIIHKWFVNNKISLLPWPSQSPDLNPIENLWSYLERKMSGRRPNNKFDLEQILKAEWEKIPQDYCRKLVESMPKRIREVIKAKGGHTKY